MVWTDDQAAKADDHREQDQDQDSADWMITWPETNKITRRSGKNDWEHTQAVERTKSGPPSRPVCNNQANDASEKKQLKRVRRQHGSQKFGNTFQE
jgi:hypothetical protein